ncbi:MAG: hypothetical protein FWH18_08470 [Marinilabiliaceae bacterium]|nr:hypothetical protein [Marinilabiliaceae bacterium]
MNKPLKIIVNILIFTLIAGFGFYVGFSTKSDYKIGSSDTENQETEFVSPYKKANSFDLTSDVLSFDIYEDKIFVALQDKVSVFDFEGNKQYDFEINSNVRDIVAIYDTIFVLYPTEIELYTIDGQLIDQWEACSDNADYCAFTISNNYLFVTDADNKLIVQYNKDGQLIRFIKSPHGFVIPSYAFDIICINDTIYCSNSGRHKIESFTIDGTFIASYGVSGNQAGEFSGCCNPVYLEKTEGGNILTSEKGNPRISSFSKHGKFRTILLDSNMLGNGTDAYRMKIQNKNLFVAGKKSFSIYTFDCKQLRNPCSGCDLECPTKISRKKQTNDYD